MATNFYKHRIYLFFNRILMNSLASSCPLLSVRMFLYKLVGMKIEKDVRINSHVFFSTSNIRIGEKSFINRYCQVHDGLMGGKLHIGKNCFISFNVVFSLVSHEIGTSKQRAGRRIAGDIIVGDGTWIGCNVTILPNVTIGNGCVIAAGSLINKNCEDNCMYAGVPAKLIKKLND